MFYINVHSQIRCINLFFILIKSTGNSLLMDSGVLHLHNVSYADAGSYWCAVTNHITTDTYVADWVTRLVVLPKPSVARKAPEFLVKPKPHYIIPQGTEKKESV